MGIRINSTGCSLIDYLYTNIDFTRPPFSKYLSKQENDGGLVPGKLVFIEEFEAFAGRPFLEAIADMTGNREPDGVNLGGPAVVAMINAAQILEDDAAELSIIGGRSEDSTGRRIMDFLDKTPLKTDDYMVTEGISPSTYVFSDPNHGGGQGERTFIHNMGSALKLSPENLPNHFFDADILLFGATAVIPPLHDSLTDLLERGKNASAVQVAGTVYDFRNEKKNPEARWPMGDSDKTYQLMDLLITDREEALRLSGSRSIEEAVRFFKEKGTDSVIITQGAEPVHLYSDGGLFSPMEPASFPISALAGKRLAMPERRTGDTTGCGDNFVGGVLASIAMQMGAEGGDNPAAQKRSGLDLVEALSWGVASGAFACFTIGGTYIESRSGEKRAGIQEYYEAYRRQLAEEGRL